MTVRVAMLVTDGSAAKIFLEILVCMSVAGGIAVTHADCAVTCVFVLDRIEVNVNATADADPVFHV